ncbi:MAG: UvrD-helicase domain-containing protein [Noviherbaspirillum sp.]
MDQIVLTDEQRAVVESAAPDLVVNAYAGTGKTTTLRAYAAARPQQRMLYLAFNKVTASEAARSFPANVSCRTVHSLAYGAIGHRYRHKLGQLRPSDIMRLYQGVTAAMADLLVRTLDNFMVSADDSIAVAHVPNELALSDRQQFAGAGERLWNDMQDPDKATPLPHDGYLKLYQLSRPALWRRHDVILLDEAQDTNPVTADIVFSQRCGKVLVGDRHQSIYGFRGSVNAMAMLPGAESHYLTQSMRFGAPVAQAATTLLRTMKGESHAIAGLGAMSATPGRVDRSRPYAIISRSNASVFAQAVQAIGQNKVHFVGGVQNYLLGRLTDVHHIWSERKDLVRDAFYRDFDDFEALTLYGRETGDKEILSLVSVVRQYRATLPGLIATVTSAACEQAGDADVLLMTAHRSKGLEFDQVLLDDDFQDLVDKKGKPNMGALDAQAFEQEINLLYVAMTRARRALELNRQCRAVLDAAQKAST